MFSRAEQAEDVKDSNVLEGRRRNRQAWRSNAQTLALASEGARERVLAQNGRGVKA